MASVSVVVAAILAVLQLKQRNDTRQAQLFMELYNEFYNPSFHRRWMELVYVYQQSDLLDSEGMPTFLTGDLDKYIEASALSSYFEGIGLLVKKGLIDINLVAELMSTPLFFVWEKVADLVMKVRELLGRPQIYEWFEYLYHEIQKIPSRQNQSSG